MFSLNVIFDRLHNAQVNRRRHRSRLPLSSSTDINLLSSVCVCVRRGTISDDDNRGERFSLDTDGAVSWSPPRGVRDRDDK